MKGNKVRCVRCKGRKKMYKVQGVYSNINTGGKEVDCPMCMGAGLMEKAPENNEDTKKINSKKKSLYERNKDFDYEKE